MGLTGQQTTDQRITEAVERGELAAFEAMCELFPEATTGDFPPDASIAFSRALESALRTWLSWNTDLLGN